MGQNNYNFGNYLWGAAARTLKVPLGLAKLGAHYNNIMTDPENQNKPMNQRTLDSPDDQRSIEAGWNLQNSRIKR